MTALCLFLAVAAFFDYSKGKIPNPLLIIMLLAGAGQSFGMGGAAGGGVFLAEVVMITALLYPLFMIGTVGAGDVKLLGICAGYFPRDKILYFLFFSMLWAAIFSLIKLWRMKNVKERLLYLGEYLMEVAQTGKWRLYMENERERRTAGICMSGPVLISALLYMGGVY
ncbi:MAG: A24 family peptidase [Lachnoclostridium sp.]|nr:A24 family peptidase [Lachnospira sp.]MCM1246942.1 A24 family peptidase [Lachnoclostridium sp.]